MDTRIVTLHGGPRHGMQMEIPGHIDHIHIAGMRPGVFDVLLAEQQGGSLPTDQPMLREGIYSQVSGVGNHNNFEWDGWVGDLGH